MLYTANLWFSLHFLVFIICRFLSINEAEIERERRAAGRNTLEARILDIKDKMGQDEYIKASVEKDQTHLAQLCNQVRKKRTILVFS